MPHYELTKDAEKDLQRIARYTLKKWGKSQAQRYASGLKHTFKLIGENKVLPRFFLPEISSIAGNKISISLYLLSHCKKCKASNNWRRQLSLRIDS